MQHLDEGTVHAWLDGALPPDEAARVEQHAATCAGCSMLVADARGLIAGAARIVSSLDVVRGAGGVLPARARPPQSLWSRLHLTPARAALAASLLVAVSALMVARRAPHQDVAKEMAPASMSASLTPAPAPTAASSPTTKDQPNALPTPASASTHARAPESPLSQKAAVVASPPSRTVASVDTNRVARDSAAQRVAGNVASSAPAAAIPSTASADRGIAAERRVNPESLKARDANPASALPLSRRFSKIAQLQEVVTTNAADASAAKTSSARIAPCYRIDADAVAPLHALPARIALLDSAADTVHVVRMVGADGRVGEPLIGASWRRLSPIAASVLFTAPDPNTPMTLLITAGAPSAKASWSGESRQIDVRPTNCFTP